MRFNIALRNLLIVLFGALVLSACSTAKKGSDLQGDVYTGTETIEYLAKGVPDRVFFATNKSSLTTAARDTLRKQATWLRKNKDCADTEEKLLDAEAAASSSNFGQSLGLGQWWSQAGDRKAQPPSHTNTELSMFLKNSLNARLLSLAKLLQTDRLDKNRTFRTMKT